MKDPELVELVDALREFLGPRLRSSPEARRLARAVGAWLSREAERAEAGAEIEGEEAGTTRPDPSPESEKDSPPLPPARSPEPTGRGTVPLSFGGETMYVDVPGDTETIGRARISGGALEPDQISASAQASEPPELIDLARIEARARLKSRSCLHFIGLRQARYDLEREGPLRRQMHELLEESKSIPGCFLWVFIQDKPLPDDDRLRTLSGGYDALADAAALMLAIEDSLGAVGRDRTGEAMALLAEASSALRVGLESTWLPSSDRDQEETHHWLRQETSRRQVFIDRYMKLDDRADPELHDDLRRRIARLRDLCESGLRDAAKIDELFKRIGYHAGKVRNDAERPDAHDIKRIVESIEALDERGVPTSDQRYDEAVPVGVAEVIVGCDSRAAVGAMSHLLTRRADAPAASPEAPAARQWSDRVREVRSLLAGRRVVMIGGEPRPDAIERIEAAFGLDRVEWPSLAEHGTGAPMRAPIARAETACVFVLIRLCGHLHAEEAAACAKAAGIPCVKLTGGYSPEQIAEALLRQASGKLRRGAGSQSPAITGG